MCLFNFKTLYIRLEIWLHNNPGYQAMHLQQQAAAKEDKFTCPSQLHLLGDILSYDGDNGIETVRIKDYCSSVVNGQYYIVTSILDPDSEDDSCDVRVDDEKMQDWLECRVNVECEVEE
jgi:hypothetical protein